MTPHRIEIVEAPLTFALRRAVLRPNWSLEKVAAEDLAALTFAARRDGDDLVLSSASLLEEPAPTVIPSAARQSERCFRLRFMATRPEDQGRGIGSEVLQALLAHLALSGGGLLWCNAREGAISFYTRAGFRTAGPRFIEEEIGAHIVMWRLVAAQPNEAARDMTPL